MGASGSKSNMASVDKSVPQADVEIYTRSGCGYCTRVKALMGQIGAEYTEIDAGSSADKKAEMVERANGGRTFPQVFVAGKHYGGCDDVTALHREGKLEPLIWPAEAGSA